MEDNLKLTINELKKFNNVQNLRLSIIIWILNEMADFSNRPYDKNGFVKLYLHMKELFDSYKYEFEDEVNVKLNQVLDYIESILVMDELI